MNKFILLLLVFAQTLNASTDSNVTVNLNFAKDAEKLANEVETEHLIFVQEEVSFPEGPQKRKFEKALSIIEHVMNSEEFKQRVIAYQSSTGRVYQKNYLWNQTTRRLSNEDIYQVIMNGDERMSANTPGEMIFNSWVKVCSFFERMGIWCRSVIGSTTPDTSKFIKLNWKFYSTFETHHMVANMVHEWLHLLGFLHGNQRIHEEVPYVVGSIAGEIAKEILQRENGLN